MIITIVATKPKKFKIGAEFIKFWQNTDYSHIAIIRHRPWTNLTMVYQASHGMVHQIWADNFFADNEIVEQFKIERSERQIKEFEISASKLQGTKYGAIGLVVLAAARVVQKICANINHAFRDSFSAYILAQVQNWGDGKKTMHCSELAAALLPEIIQYSTEKNIDRIEPVHIVNALKQMPEVLCG